MRLWYAMVLKDLGVHPRWKRVCDEPVDFIVQFGNSLGKRCRPRLGISIPRCVAMVVVLKPKGSETKWRRQGEEWDVQLLGP